MVKKNISSLKNCYGCGVCSSVCPQNIIDIVENKNGFYQPIIHSPDRCTSCELCLKSCSFVSETDNSSDSIESYAAWSLDKEIRFQASTGGVAYEIAKYALVAGYQVCGAVYNTDSNRAEHIIIDNEADLKKTLGSKYIPSYSATAFNQLLSKENRDKKFAVFGTPCQIASLRLAIRRFKRENNFLLVDFFCHGVPSMLAWYKYINEKNLKDKSIYTISWRDKKFGWHDSWYIVGKQANNKEAYRSNKVNRDEFFQFFLSHYGLSPCCIESCKFKKTSSLADIRVGDLWGEAYKSNQDGVNGVLCMTPKGGSVIQDMKSIAVISEKTEVVIEGQMAKNAVAPSGYKWALFLLRNSNFKLSSILTIIRLPNRVINIAKRAICKIIR